MLIEMLKFANVFYYLSILWLELNRVTKMGPSSQKFNFRVAKIASINTRKT